MQSILGRRQNALSPSRGHDEVLGRAPAGQEKYMRFVGVIFTPRLTILVLEIGCYTSYSASAWYESTVSTKAEIITLELDPKTIAASRRTFDKYKLNNRVTLIEGPAAESIKKLTGEFDIIFVDANKDGYEPGLDASVLAQMKNEVSLVIYIA